MVAKTCRSCAVTFDKYALGTMSSLLVGTMRIKSLALPDVVVMIEENAVARG